jgi:putative phosphoribosyl transferase
MFRNRADAGRQLAVALAHLRALDVVVLGLPRGGVTVGSEVAAALATPEPLLAIGEAYRDFSPISDDEVVELLKRPPGH